MSFVPPSGPCPAPIMLVGEAPGEQEILRGMPFVGASGMELDRMLNQAGIMRSTCFTTNVVRDRPENNDITKFMPDKKRDITEAHVLVRDRMVLPVVAEGIKLLISEIQMCRPNVIIAFGNVALWALTGQWGITKWRGSLLECDLDLGIGYKPKVIPTYHPAAILRTWSWRSIALADLRKARRHSTSRELVRPKYNFIVRPQFTDAYSTLNKLHAEVMRGETRLAVDLETRVTHMACVGIAWSKTDAICIPWMCVENHEGYWTAEQETRLSYLLFRILTHPNCKVIGQNFLYDSQYFWRRNHYIPNVFRDTMLMQHSCFANMPKGLDFISSMYREDHVYWKDEGKTWDTNINEEVYWRYNCMDAVATYECAELLEKTIDQMGVREVYTFQQSMFMRVLNMMNRGVRVDHELRSRYVFTMIEEMAKREQWFIDVLDHPLNPRSAPQMQALFYQDFAQRPVLNRKTMMPSCDDEALLKISNRQPLLTPLCKKIREYRSLGTVLANSVNAPLDYDGRMRSSFNIAGTETYRFSSSENAFGNGMNMQNLTKGGADSDEEDALEIPNVRSMFIPDPGMTMFDIDLYSADLRIVVWESDEQEMKAMLRAGLDPYTEVAKEFYHDPTIDKKDPRRQKFKAFCHGTNYLGTAKGLAERLGLTVHEAEKTQQWYFRKFPRIKKWQDNLKTMVETKKMVQNVFGYRCYFFDRIEGTIYNQAAAWIPQSTVGCLINRAWAAIEAQLPEVQILLQVHDSLAGQFPTVKREFYEREIIRCAEVEIPYPGDPLVIPVGIKCSDKSWGDCG